MPDVVGPPTRASERVRGIAKGSYAPDPDTYLRELRDEAEAALIERQRVAGRNTRREASEVD